MNKLFYGDNLHVLRDRTHFPDACVDLIYLDPPFNSKRDYNLLFKSPKGQSSEAQIEAFEDTWHWNAQAEREYDEIVKGQNTDLAQMIQALRSFLGENDMMACLTIWRIALIRLRNPSILVPNLTNKQRSKSNGRKKTHRTTQAGREVCR